MVYLYIKDARLKFDAKYYIQLFFEIRSVGFSESNQNIFDKHAHGTRSTHINWFLVNESVIFYAAALCM